jgi:hypothetical protein
MTPVEEFLTSIWHELSDEDRERFVKDVEAFAQSGVGSATITYNPDTRQLSITPGINAALMMKKNELGS